MQRICFATSYEESDSVSSAIEDPLVPEPVPPLLLGGIEVHRSIWIVGSVGDQPRLQRRRKSLWQTSGGRLRHEDTLVVDIPMVLVGRSGRLNVPGKWRVHGRLDHD